jgi:hypothetical protein
MLYRDIIAVLRSVLNTQMHRADTVWDILMLNLLVRNVDGTLQTVKYAVTKCGAVVLQLHKFYLVTR